MSRMGSREGSSGVAAAVDASSECNINIYLYWEDTLALACSSHRCWYTISHNWHCFWFLSLVSDSWVQLKWWVWLVVTVGVCWCVLVNVDAR